MNRDKFLDRFQKVPVDVYHHQTHAEPLVSVCVQTYQHVNFIKDCLDGILMQQTDFPFEILLGEDSSSDGTREVCINYAEKYPDKIRFFLHHRENNIKINGIPTGRFNFMYNLFSARGKYIALCEGDDYWTDSKKLQKQVDFLENHHEFAICFHWAGWLDQEAGQITHWEYGPPVIKSHFTVDDLLEYSNFIPTCSTVFRNNIPHEFPDWYYKIEIGDLPLHIMNTQYGQIGFIDEKMGVRRWHAKGVYGGNTKINNFQKSLRSLHLIGSEMNLDKRTCFRLGVSKLYGKLSQAYKEENKPIEAFIVGIKSVLKAPFCHKKEALQHMLSIFVKYESSSK